MRDIYFPLNAHVVLRRFYLQAILDIADILILKMG